MNTRTKLLHDMRGQQLRALHKGIGFMTKEHQDMVARYAALAGEQYDTRPLSDKALEDIDVLSDKYLDRVA